jgi:hypothetical protein
MDNTSPQAPTSQELRCNVAIDHVEGCRLCKTYLRSEIKFLYFVVVILSSIIIYYIIRDHEKQVRS